MIVADDGEADLHRSLAIAAQAAWLLSRCHVVLGHGELALHHADECAAAVAATSGQTGAAASAYSLAAR